MACLVAAACLAGPSQEPPTTTDAASGPAVVVEEGGVRVTVALDRGGIRPGEEVQVTLTATNISGAVLTYPGAARDDCLLTGSFWIDFDGLDIPAGDSLTGVSGWVKDGVLAALVDGVSLPSDLDEARPICDLLEGPAVLRPGESVGAVGVWDGRLSDGYPAPAGTYDINARFWVIDGPGGETRLETSVPIVVTAGEMPAPPGIALDRVLANGQVETWLKANEQRTWTEFRFEYEPEERRYTLEIATPVRRLVVRVEGDGRGPVFIEADTDP